MRVFVHIVTRISQACGIVAAGLIILAVLVIGHLVWVRYFLGESAIWQHEFVTFSLIASTFIGSPYVLLHRGHVNVDLIPLYLGHTGRMVMAWLSSLISLAFCLILAWSGWEMFHEAWVKGWTEPTVWAPPLWVPYLSVPLGMGLLSLQYVADLVALSTGQASPFGIKEYAE